MYLDHEFFNQTFAEQRRINIFYEPQTKTRTYLDWQRPAANSPRKIEPHILIGTNEFL